MVLPNTYDRNLSPWYGASLGCLWRRHPPDKESNCEYDNSLMLKTRYFVYEHNYFLT
jgi:hypothetical protein